jgi:DNA-binding transcriptional regulator YdaS (Cro superfamily)
MQLTPAHLALARWLQEERGRAASLADALRVRAQAVSLWRHGRATPKPTHWVRIERITAGAVKAALWQHTA